MRPEQPLLSYSGTASFRLESLVQSDPAIDQLIRQSLTRQSGISPSASHPFIFSGSTGEAYGYEDGWQQAEQTFLYSGEGQLGDMNFTRGKTTGG